MPSPPRKLLYAVQATGNGHLARARTLAPALAQQSNLQVDYLFSGRLRAELFDMQAFGNFRCLRGLTLFYARGRINTFDTVVKNNWHALVNDIRGLDLSDYDAVINDFEPVSAWAARLQQKACIGLSHQCAFFYGIPKVLWHPFSRFLMHNFAPCQQKIGLHWHHFGQPILPPLIDRMQFDGTPIRNKIVVYMGFEALADIETLLKRFDTHMFHIYSPAVAAPCSQGNLVYEPLSLQHFRRDLLDCEGVISNAGFELASECIQLGKKILVKPLRGQFEQLSNALALKQLGYGAVMQGLSETHVRKWLAAPAREPRPFPEVATPLAQWIAQGDWNDVAALAQRIWAQRAKNS